MAFSLSRFGALAMLLTVSTYVAMYYITTDENLKGGEPEELDLRRKLARKTDENLPGGDTANSRLEKCTAVQVDEAFCPSLPVLDQPAATTLKKGSDELHVGELSLREVVHPHKEWPMSDTPYIFLSHTGQGGVKKDIARPPKV